jgi:hypothetical protein
MAGDTHSLWLERYAEILGCDCRPGLIAVEIERLKSQVDRIPAEMARNRRLSRELAIEEMRRGGIDAFTG